MNLRPLSVPKLSWRSARRGAPLIVSLMAHALLMAALAGVRVNLSADMQTPAARFVEVALATPPPEPQATPEPTPEADAESEQPHGPSTALPARGGNQPMEGGQPEAESGAAPEPNAEPKSDTAPPTEPVPAEDVAEANPDTQVEAGMPNVAEEPTKAEEPEPKPGEEVETPIQTDQPEPLPDAQAADETVDVERTEPVDEPGKDDKANEADEEKVATAPEVLPDAPAKPDDAVPDLTVFPALAPKEIAALEAERQELAEARMRLAVRRAKLEAKIEETASKPQRVQSAPASAGVIEGVVRRLELRQYSQSQIDQLFKRYGITVEVKYVPAVDPRSTFLNSASTDAGTYQAGWQSGKFEVMSLTRPAVARMVELEEEKLGALGLNPAKTRVIEVVFGLSGGGDATDFAITTFRYESLE